MVTMNIFRLAGDMTHLLSIIVLLLKIRATRSCKGRDQPEVPRIPAVSQPGVPDLMCYVSPRHLETDSGTVSFGIRHPLFGPFLLLHLPVSGRRGVSL